MADKNFNTVPVASAIDPADYLHATIGNTHNRITVDTLIAKAKAESLSAMEAALLDKLTDGCFIMYHECCDGTAPSGLPRARRASEWTAKQNLGEVALGVLVVEGGHALLVAPTEATDLNWSSSNVQVSPSDSALKPYSDRTLCAADFTGKEKTAAILANATIGGDGSGYAPGFCAAYSRSNTISKGDNSGQTKGIGAGAWWLPSIGELMMIWANKQKINACLALITGATQFTTGVHWSASENSQASAWCLFLSDGNMGAYLKASPKIRARPVSAFLTSTL